ncbi:MAG: hypothetical protein WC855_11720 [Thermodesulfovibrionales bacterium]
MESSVKKIHQDGLEISLMDGSKWKIKNIGDMTRTILWYPTQHIKVEEKGDGEFTLTNLNTSAPDEIEVSRIR